MSEAKSKAAATTLRTNEKKWSKPLMDAGWTAFPNVIIENQKQLGLTPVDLCILIHLASKWWTADGKPYPSKGTIAKALDLAPRTVQRRIAAMEKAKFLKRQERRTPTGSKTNIYHFDGLIEAAKPFAEEKLKDIAERTAIKKIRAARKGKPSLALVKS